MATVRRLAGHGRCTWCGRVKKRLYYYSTDRGIYAGRFCSAEHCELYWELTLERPIKIIN